MVHQVLVAIISRNWVQFLHVVESMPYFQAALLSAIGSVTQMRTYAVQVMNGSHRKLSSCSFHSLSAQLKLGSPLTAQQLVRLCGLALNGNAEVKDGDDGPNNNNKNNSVKWKQSAFVQYSRNKLRDFERGMRGELLADRQEEAHRFQNPVVTP